MRRTITFLALLALTGCFPKDAFRPQTVSAVTHSAEPSLLDPAPLIEDAYVPDQTYEYMLLYLGAVPAGEWVANLNALGAKGWKVVGYHHRGPLLLMREAGRTEASGSGSAAAVMAPESKPAPTASKETGN